MANALSEVFKEAFQAAFGAKTKNIARLLPLALLGGYAVGMLGARIQDLMAADGQRDWSTFLMPEPISAILGLFVFGAGAWFLGRQDARDVAQRFYGNLRGKLDKKGLLKGINAISGEHFNIAESEQATLALLDRFVSQVSADRQEAEKYKEALSKYMDPSLAIKIKHESNYSQVPSKRVSVAVLFTDIRGFTKMSETLTIEEVVRILNDYFALAAQAVKRNSGQINKFIGDAVLAVFEDPFGGGATASQNAINAAMEMTANFRRRLSAWQEGISTPFTADLGAGVHFGPVIMGNLGSGERMEYTCIGDTVNFTSRLCSLAKGGQVKISQECYTLVQTQFEAQAQEPVSVKGKTGEFITYLVTGLKNKWMSPNINA